MAHLTEKEIGEMIDKVRAEERERCAVLAEALATRFEESAKWSRREGSFITRAIWPFMKTVTSVRPSWENHARALEAGARALRDAIARGCREGWDPRKLPTQEPDERGLH